MNWQSLAMAQNGHFLDFHGETGNVIPLVFQMCKFLVHHISHEKVVISSELLLVKSSSHAVLDVFYQVTIWLFNIAMENHHF